MKAEINLSFDQLIELVRQLPNKEKVKLGTVLEKDLIQSRLAKLLTIFKTDELDLSTIDKESEAVRQQIYGKKS